MAIRVSHFCALFLCLACISTAPGCSGDCPRANHKHTLSVRVTGLPTLNAKLELYPGRTSSDSLSQHALLERPGNDAAGGRRQSASIYGLLKYSIFDFCRFLLDTITRSPFTRKQVSDQRPSKAEHNHNVMFVFGDSLFDAGNIKYINNNSDYAHYPYGYTYFPNGTGRVCDGRVVPDFIAEYAGLPFIPALMQPGADFSSGANFASAGSTVLDTDSLSGFNVINLKEQVGKFKEMVGKYNETLGPRTAGEMLRKAVYLFSTGGNDYISYYSDFMEKDHVPTQVEQQQFVEEIIGNITDAIMEIYENGARKFAFQNVGPIGCLPMVDIEFPKLNGSCAAELLSMPMLHNEKLYGALTDLAERLEGFKFSVMDYYSSLYDRLINPSKYGFEVGRMPCYRSMSAASQLGAKDCGNRALCEYPSAYVLFNEAHTTQSTNAQIANLIWSGDPSVTRPYNVKQLFEEE